MVLTGITGSYFQPENDSYGEVRSKCIFTNTMAECRSGRKCIAVKLNISDISRVFA